MGTFVKFVSYEPIKLVLKIDHCSSNWIKNRMMGKMLLGSKANTEAKDEEDLD